MNDYCLAVDRYAYGTIAARVVRQTEQAIRAGKTLKGIYTDLGFTKDAWSKKTHVRADGLRGRSSSFTLTELSRIADYFEMPPGWPFVDDEYARALSEAFATMRGRPLGPRRASTASAAPRRGTSQAQH